MVVLLVADWAAWMVERWVGKMEATMAGMMVESTAVK
jgi:hypothetical protein